MPSQPSRLATLGKRLLASRFAARTIWLAIRVYRFLIFSGFLLRHDPRLLALLRSREPALFAVWHQDFPWTLGYLSRWNSRRPTYVLASGSRDGGIAAAAAAGVGFRSPVRGSSARGGARALLGLHRALAEGERSLAVVCDGPRPPAREMKAGILQVARETGLPLWLVRTSWRPAHVLGRTWARFVIPGLGARGVVGADGPIRVPPDADRDDLERLRVELEGRLNALADATDASVGQRSGSNRL